MWQSFFPGASTILERTLEPEVFVICPLHEGWHILNCALVYSLMLTLAKGINGLSLEFFCYSLLAIVSGGRQKFLSLARESNLVLNYYFLMTFAQYPEGTWGRRSCLHPPTRVQPHSRVFAHGHRAPDAAKPCPWDPRGWKREPRLRAGPAGGSAAPGTRAGPSRAEPGRMEPCRAEQCLGLILIHH